MKGKWLAIMIIAVLAVLPGVFTVMISPTAHAKAASTIMSTQSWTVSFTQTLKTKNITDKYVYVTDNAGQKVTATITLGDDKKSLVVSNLSPGSYRLHVKKGAFAFNSLKTKTHEIDFTVIDKLEAVKSDKELQQYFEALVANGNVEREVNTLEDSASSSKDSASSSNNASTTNNQVEGVEEGDIVVVKDGFIYAIKDQDITVVDANNPKSLKLATTIKQKASQYITKLALYNNVLIAIGEEYIEKENTSMSTAMFYDISNPKKPQLIREVAQEGYLQDIRITNDTLYLIGTMYPNYWILQEEGTPDLKPKMYDSAVSKEYKSLSVDKISILPNTMDGTYSLITAVGLKNGVQTVANTKGYLGGSSGLYMSQDALYLTTPIYDGNQIVPSGGIIMDRIWMPVSNNTQVFKWDVDGTALNFVGTSEVKGSVLNQYSMDEYEGNFRIVTTEGNMWDEKNISRNHLFILDKNLKEIGAVKNLAPGEKVYSARFMGEKAYVVTFKQVDPLFVIDVANPRKPRVLGELKIPGYSNYLHPLDDTHLIGIGYDTEERFDNFTKSKFTVTTNMKLSLFDVTDFNNPKEQSTVKIGGKGSYSDVQYNPKALFRNKDYHYYGFPVVLYEAASNDEVVYQGQGAQIYEITAENGIILKGNIIDKNTSEPYENWEQIVQRVVYVGDALYTIARNEVKSYQLNDFKALDTLIIK